MTVSEYDPSPVCCMSHNELDSSNKLHEDKFQWHLFEGQKAKGNDQLSPYDYMNTFEAHL